MPAVVFAVLGALLRAPLRPPSATLTPSCSSKRCSTPTSVATAEAPGATSTSWLQEELQLTDAQLKLLAAKLPSLDTPQQWVTMPSGARVRREATVEENLRPVLQLLRARAFPRDQITQMALRFPDFLATPSETVAAAVDSLAGVGLSQSEVVNVTTRFPPLLRYNLSSKIDELRDVGFVAADIGEMSLQFPPLFNVEAEAKVGTLVDAGFSRAQVLDMARRYPAMLAYDLAARVAECLSEGLTHADLVAAPQKLGFDYSKRIEACVAAGFARADATALARRFPPFQQLDPGQSMKELRALGIERPHDMVLETPAILGFAGIADRARELFRAGFDGEDSRLVVTASPLLLGTNITQAVETLRTAGFSRKDVLALSRSVPGFLGSRTCALLDELAERGFPRPECVRLIVAQPGLLAYDLPQRLGQLCELGFSHKDALSMARQRPALFNANVSDTLAALELHGGLAAADARKVVGAFPAALGYNLPERVLRLRAEGVAVDPATGAADDALLAKLLKRCPQLLGYDVGARLAGLHEVGFSRDAALRLVHANPKVLSYDAAAQFGRLERLGGWSREEVRAMVLTFPPILGLDVDRNVGPKLRYLQARCGLTAAAAAAWPGAFGYSLEKRIAPRVEVLRARGVDAWPSLSSLLAPGQDAFVKRYAVGEREWAAAVEGAPAAVSSFLEVG